MVEQIERVEQRARVVQLALLLPTTAAERAVLTAAQAWYRRPATKAEAPTPEDCALEAACRALYGEQDTAPPPPVTPAPPATAPPAADTCPKCGSADVGMAYHAARDVCSYSYRQRHWPDQDQLGEHLHCICRRCHYDDWVLPCIVQQEAP